MSAAVECPEAAHRSAQFGTTIFQSASVDYYSLNLSLICVCRLNTLVLASKMNCGTHRLNPCSTLVVSRIRQACKRVLRCDTARSEFYCYWLSKEGRI